MRHDPRDMRVYKADGRKEGRKRGFQGQSECFTTCWVDFGNATLTHAAATTTVAKVTGPMPAVVR